METPHSPSQCDECDICFYYNAFEIRDLPLSNPWSGEERRRSSTLSHVEYSPYSNSFNLPSVSYETEGDFQSAINSVAQRYDQISPANQWNSFAFYDSVRRGGNVGPRIKRKPVPPPKDESALKPRAVSTPLQMQRPTSFYPGEFSSPMELESPNTGSFSLSHSDSFGSLSDDEEFSYPNNHVKITAPHVNRLGNGVPDAILNSPKLQRTLGTVTTRHSLMTPTIRAVPAAAEAPELTSSAGKDKFRNKRLQKKWRYSMSS